MDRMTSASPPAYMSIGKGIELGKLGGQGQSQTASAVVCRGASFPARVDAAEFSSNGVHWRLTGRYEILGSARRPLVRCGHDEISCSAARHHGGRRNGACLYFTGCLVRELSIAPN